MRKLLVCALIVVSWSLTSVASANAHYIKDPTKAYYHALGVKTFFKNRPHLARTPAGRVALKNHTWLLAHATAKLRPPQIGPQHIADSCLRAIIHRETAGTWDHTIWNYQGSGAYGLPQALPADKMASAGSDYMTNPWTQIKWMIGYVNGRYGGSCAALAFHNRNGWY